MEAEAANRERAEIDATQATDTPPQPRVRAPWEARTPRNEEARLESLSRLEIMDTEPEVAFDRAVAVASRLLRTPIALVGLIDARRQWFKSCIGIDSREAPREMTFCSHAILSSEVMVVLDTHHDERFQDHPAVMGEPFLRFYAGAPLVASDGALLGTLCVADTSPREDIAPEDLHALRDLSAVVVSEMEMRLSARRLEEENRRRREAEEKALEAQERLALALAGGRMGVWELDLVLQHATFSDTMESLLGLEQGSFDGTLDSFMALVHPDDRESIPGTMAHFIETGVDPAAEFRIVRPDGDVLWLAGRSHLVRDESGRPVRMVGLSIDITARKRAEQALQAAHDALEFRVRQRTRELAEANEGLQREVRERESAQVAQREMSRGLEAILRIADGLLSCSDVDCLTRRSVEGLREVLGLERCSIFLLDSELQSQAQSQARAQSQELDEDEQVVWRGTYGTNMEGHTVNEHHLYGPFSWSAWSRAAHSTFPRFGPSSKETSEGETRWKRSEQEGSWRVAIPIASERGVIGILFNDAQISRTPLDEAKQEAASVFCSLLGGLIEKTRALEHLKASEERFRILSESGPGFVWTARADGVLDYYNHRFLHFAGRSLEEMQTQGWQDLMHPDDLEAAAQGWADSIATGQPHEVEFRFKDRATGGFRWFLGRGEPQRDADGNILKWFGTCTDIQRRKAAEASLHDALEALQSAHDALTEANARLEERVLDRTHELERSNSLLHLEVAEREKAEASLERYARELERSNSDLQQFAYVASHDLQEPLRAVASYVQLLEKRYSDRLDDDARVFIGHAVEGARRMRQLIQDLLSFARVGSRGKEFAPVDCEVALAKAKRALQVAMEESQAQITHDALPTISGDASQITQLLQNLLSNALKYRSEEPPRIHISARDNGVGDWEFSIRDNGLGIAPEHNERIFEIFQRLHGREEYSGTGIGLALCKKIIERHNGRIWVESQEGGGATFFWTLPQALQVLEAAKSGY